MITIGWRNVSDSLPKQGEKVLARYDGVYGPRLVTFRYDAGGNPHFGAINEVDGKGSQPATHWRSIDE